MARLRLVVVSVMALLCGLVVVLPPAARAQANGIGLTPAMGWSSWSALRRTPTAAKIEAEADALHGSGLAALGYRYVNLDDFWYQCPGPQGPAVDGYGRWVTDATSFPSSGSTDGIAAVADYVHSLGLRFGLYVTPGISAQAVSANTPILGTTYHADDIAEPDVPEVNYNCHGMVGIDYTRPAAQAFINSWADELASWGVDYVKLDGVGTSDVPDIQAWSSALQQTGRPILLELSNTLPSAAAPTWQQYANGWRTGRDIECYCGSSGASYPLTDWNHVLQRFDQVAEFQPYGGPGGFNDYDSIEVGNGANDGLTPAERQSQISLWAMAASPMMVGADLTALDPGDLSDLSNVNVLAVDQDGIDAARVVDSADAQVFAKTETNGDVVIGLFNTSTTNTVSISLPLTSAGLDSGASATDLWSGTSLGTISGTYSVTLDPGAVQLIRAVPSDVPNPPTATPTPPDTQPPAPTPSPTIEPPPSDSVTTTPSTDPAATPTADPPPNQPPRGTITAPVSGATMPHGWVSFTGTAADDTGLKAAYLSIRNRATGKWLTGASAWATGVAQLPVTLATKNARSTAWADNVQVPAAKVTVTLRVVDTAGASNVAPRPSRALTLR